jgi:hypothetical protein
VPSLQKRVNRVRTLCLRSKKRTAHYIPNVDSAITSTSGYHRCLEGSTDMIHRFRSCLLWVVWNIVF